jgi:IS30 family transposase
LENWLPYKEYKAYFADTGLAVWQARKTCRGGKYKIFGDENLVKYIEDKILIEKLSPDAVIGGLKETGHNFKVMVCTKSVYNYIDRELIKVKNIDLLMKLRLKPKKKRIKAHKNV